MTGSFESIERTPSLSSNSGDSFTYLFSNLVTSSLSTLKVLILPKVENSIEVREAKKGKICPRCGAAWVLRTVKNGDRAGNKFFGCSEYPKCRYTENIQH